MKLRFVISLVGLALLVYLLNMKLGMIPPLGKFLDPVNGFWQNAESKEQKPHIPTELKGLKSHVRVVFDDRQVPHIYADNLHDMYYMQGYVTAYHRLWQMEFQTMAAGGRISELVGEKAIPFDKEQRRIGMVYAAERAIEAFEEDTLTRDIMSAYTDGVNSYISSLDKASLPLEYKLLDYEPEEWTPLKSALLLKMMAKNLTYNENDFENTNALKLLGKETFRLLFPEYANDESPIIPKNTTYDNVSINLDSSTADLDYFIDRETYSEPASDIGSNNWAVSGRLTETGYPILCGDPHLSLSLPSIWYEIQLACPEMNVYGVSLPGSPNIILGFNDSIAWSVTNAGRDVKDWYAIEFKDDTKSEYKYEGEWLPTQKRIEAIKVRGGETVYDTVPYTHHGPVVYEMGENSGTGMANLALKWIAHGWDEQEPPNELLTFYNLNRGKNYQDYEQALKTYQCPAQNFVFASHSNDIAIWQNGLFPARWPEHGRYIMDGSKKLNDWQARIPQEHNPHIVNPERGFVSSANQHPTDSTYPYYYTGVFEYYRNRRINNELSRMSSVSVEDMMKLQQDNYNLTAADLLPVLLELLDTNDFAKAGEEAAYMRLALAEMKKWDYYNEADRYAPTIFEIWMEELQFFVWDELSINPIDTSKYYEEWWDKEKNEVKKRALNNGNFEVDYPDPPVLLKLLKEHPDHILFDNKASKRVETAKDMVFDSFYWTSIKYHDLMEYKLKPVLWGGFKATGVRHLARIDAFSVLNVNTGGNRHIVNAMSPTNGPSWRMVVALGPELRAYGIYPGGQSGNPGSHYYANAIEKWAVGDYYELKFISTEDFIHSSVIPAIAPAP